MAEEWLELEFIGLNLSKAEALARFSELQSSLVSAGLKDPRLSWSEENQRIVVNFK